MEFLDGDGAYEIIVHQTGQGHDNAHYDITSDPIFRSTSWMVPFYEKSILEAISTFEERTGVAIDTVDYLSERGDLCAWRDTRADQLDHFFGRSVSFELM